MLKSTRRLDQRLAHLGAHSLMARLLANLGTPREFGHIGGPQRSSKGRGEGLRGPSGWSRVMRDRPSAVKSERMDGIRSFLASWRCPNWEGHKENHDAWGPVAVGTSRYPQAQ